MPFCLKRLFVSSRTPTTICVQKSVRGFSVEIHSANYKNRNYTGPQHFYAYLNEARGELSVWDALGLPYDNELRERTPSYQVTRPFWLHLAASHVKLEIIDVSAPGKVSLFLDGTVVLGLSRTMDLRVGRNATLALHQLPEVGVERYSLRCEELITDIEDGGRLEVNENLIVEAHRMYVHMRGKSALRGRYSVTQDFTFDVPATVDVCAIRLSSECLRAQRGEPIETLTPHPDTNIRRTTDWTGSEDDADQWIENVLCADVGEKRTREEGSAQEPALKIPRWDEISV